MGVGMSNAADELVRLATNRFGDLTHGSISPPAGF